MDIHIEADKSLSPSNHGKTLSDLYFKYHSGLVTINGLHAKKDKHGRPFYILERSINDGSVDSVQIKDIFQSKSYPMEIFDEKHDREVDETEDEE